MVIFGRYRGYIRVPFKEVLGVMLGLYGDNGKENGNYNLGLGFRVWGIVPP